MFSLHLCLVTHVEGLCIEHNFSVLQHETAQSAREPDRNVIIFYIHIEIKTETHIVGSAIKLLQQEL